MAKLRLLRLLKRPPKTARTRPRDARGRLTAALAAVSLLAAPAAAPAADPVLAAAGDIACAPGSTVDATHCRQLGVSSLVLSQRPDMVATLGDNQYGSGSYADYLGAFDPSWGRLKPLLRPAAGNHEYALSPLAPGYTSYFGAPAQAYSYDLGTWHVVSLNSNCGETSCADRSYGQVSAAEVRWLQADLDAHPGQCTLAYWHHPLFSSSDLGGSPGVRPLWSALYAHGADVVLAGHDHHYERLAPRDPAGARDPKGLRSFVVGTGGRSLIGFPATLSAASEDHESSFGALFLTLRPGGYEWAFRREDGSVADSGSAPCHAAPPPAPAPAPAPAAAPPPAPVEAAPPVVAAPPPAALPARVYSLKVDGLRVRLGCAGPCRMVLTLWVRGRRVARRVVVRRQPGRWTLRLRPTRRVRAARLHVAGRAAGRWVSVDRRVTAA
jgi:hypothetical protein